MKRILPLIFASISVSALATPIAYEGFDYALTPTNLIGHATSDGFTWDQAGPTTGVTNVPSINAGSLSYPGLSPSVGNSVKFGGIDSGGMAARFSLKNSVTTGTVYYSFLLQVTDITGLTTSGVFFAGFNNTAGASTSVPSVVATRLVIKTNAASGGFLLGLDKSSGSTPLFQFDPTVHNVGDTVFVVGSYTFNSASSTDDVSQMWINPDSSTFGAATPPVTGLLSSTSGNDLNGNVINSFCLFNRSAAEPKSAIFDELTIGTTWSNVTPTAASMAIVTQPLDQRVVVGGKATFTVTTYRALTNQWQHNGADVPGATNSSLTINNAQLSDAGSYHLIVGNGVSTPLTSHDANLTVKPDTFPRLSPLWSIAPFSRPYVTTDSSQLPNQRYFAYNALSNQVLIVSRTNTVTGLTNPAIYVLDAGSGADLYQMNADSSVISGGLNGVALSSIDVADDGAVYGADISDASTSVNFKLYRWADSDPSTAPVKVFEGDPYGLGIERYGDSLAVRGTNVNTDVLLDDSKGLYGVIMNPTDSSMTAFMTHDFTNFIGGLTGGRTVLFGDTNTFWEHHRGGALNLANYDLTGFGSSLVTNYNNFPNTLGVCGFNFSLNLLCGINFLDNTNAPDTLDLFDISDPSLPVYLASYNFPTNFQANANRCGRVIFAGDKVFALDANNGVLAFVVVPRLTITPSGGDVLLSWPTNFTGYTLYSTLSLASPSTWSSEGAGTIVGNQHVVTNSALGTAKFYRLQQ